MESLDLIISIVAGVLVIIGFVTGFFRKIYAVFRRQDEVGQADRYPPRKSIIIVPTPGENNLWWHMGSTNGEPAMQVSAHFKVTNITKTDISLPAARMKKPKLYGGVMVKDAESNFHGGYVIPPKHTTDLSLHFWILPPRKSEGENFRADIAVLDQFGNEHWLKNLEFSYR